jgi:hypothetical protein
LSNYGWIGVDFDGTLATRKGMRPIEPMMARVRGWLASGKEVRIFTTRADDKALSDEVRQFLKDNNLPPLQITNIKSYDMDTIWDDRCVQVIPDTGEVVK